MHDLVASRILVGKTKKQVLDAFGKSADVYKFKGATEFVYTCCMGESHCSLFIRHSDDVITDAYLEINY